MVNVDNNAGSWKLVGGRGQGSRWQRKELEMSDGEMASWKAEAAAACRARSADLPDDLVLNSMFDDGLDPAAAADDATRKRYGHGRTPHRKSTASDVREFMAQNAPRD
jgi:hypothetical protein